MSAPTKQQTEPCKVCEGLCCGEIPRLMQKTASDEAVLGAIAVWLEQHQPDVYRRGLWDAIREARKGPFQMDAPRVVYRKWPGEPPHCMSCDCGMAAAHKREEVPSADQLADCEASLRIYDAGQTAEYWLKYGGFDA